MSTSLIASLRKQLPSIYGEHLPDDIRYRDADGHDVVVALDAATVDELAFAIQTANAEALALGRRRTALEELHTEARKRAARGADRIADIAWEG
jgi:outer membrane murein-binding lipoprotein Lpp